MNLREARGGGQKCLWHFEQRAVRAVRRGGKRQKKAAKETAGERSKQAVKSFPATKRKQSTSRREALS